MGQVETVWGFTVRTGSNLPGTCQELARNLPGSVKDQRGTLTRYISELFLLLPDLGKPSHKKNQAVVTWLLYISSLFLAAVSQSVYGCSPLISSCTLPLSLFLAALHPFHHGHGSSLSVFSFPLSLCMFLAALSQYLPGCFPSVFSWLISISLFIFTNSAPLGRVGHRVAMSVCLFVCLRHQVQFFSRPLIGPRIT